ncbi:MAG: peptide-methionine (R)-S-oxide reductase MsrB [Stigonema ocellatum SAG 48.90 = DSM 106950]|nr:peptide-methionine (R)-S-oxide reductase MsrB [Stigonema ocellatum SAG 48.90 = DSM 106950]
MKKRYFLQAGAAIVGTVWLSRYLTGKSGVIARSDSGFEITKKVANEQSSQQSHENSSSSPPIVKTEVEWRKILTPEQFYVLRQHGTESPDSSPLDKQYAHGTYICAGCDLPLFSSQTKFDSGTGWPSFYAPIEGAIGTSTDNSFLMTRVEVHCHRCGGHLGHVFDDGPPPTGKRYCMNGVALKFIAG